MIDMTPEIANLDKSCRAEEALKLACELVVRWGGNTCPLDSFDCCPSDSHPGSDRCNDIENCWVEYFKLKV